MYLFCLVCVYVCMCVCIYVCMYVCMYVCTAHVCVCVIVQDVYWSDVRKRTIHRVELNGSNPVILLDSSHGVGVVDGINSSLL